MIAFINRFKLHSMIHYINLIYILMLECILSSYSLTGQVPDTIGSPIVAKGARPVLISADFKFTEGPASDRQGNVYFTDQPNNHILKWSPGGTISTFMDYAGRSNGLYLDHDGNIISCADSSHQLWKIDQNRQVTVLVKDFEGKKLNGPNDLWIDPHGNIYFTDPYYKRDYWLKDSIEIPQHRVYYYNSKDHTLSIAADGLRQPNGIIGSRDGKYLFVADINDNKTYKYSINADGSLTDRKLFAAMGSDGMTIDRKGNVYLTGRGVTVFNKNGIQILHILIKEPWTANVTFGGKNHNILFITASKSVYTLQMSVKGV